MLLFPLFGWYSCDRPTCTNDNEVFEKESPDSEVYKAELARKLESIDSNELSFWLKEYVVSNGVENLNFYVQGEELCAVLTLTVNDWSGLEDIRRNKAVGRRGAEFVNLTFETQRDSNATTFLYKSYDFIID